MAGIAAASGSGPFGNAMSGINQAAQAAQAAKAQMQEGASGGGDLEGRVAQLESVQAGGAGGGEVAGAGGFSQGAIDQSARQNPMNRMKQMMGGLFGGNSRFNPFG
jgi:hypothetical protein|tara:strand:- start:374 stop:691 length:318 start_codon:yes stop_codon:yes gene_type:complete